MAYKMDSKEVDFRSLDWDDSELIKAYDKGMEKKKAELRRLKNGGKAEPTRQSVKPEWKVGDFCRAPYTVDKQYYEAKVILSEGDFCLVRFLGYGDEEEVAVADLKETLGRKSRKKQIKDAKVFYIENHSYLPSGNETNDESSASMEPGPRIDQRRTASQTAPQNFRGAEAAAPSCHGCSFLPRPERFHDIFKMGPGTRKMDEFPILRDEGVPPFIPPPPAPPMPQSSNLAQDPALSSMMVSWYMSGYYTGIYQAQKMATRCTQRCCARSGPCHH